MAKRLSRQSQVAEIIKCGKDPVYFMNKYLKIQHPIRGLIPFATFPFQDDCVKEFKNENGPSKSFLKLSQSGVGLLNSFRAINKNTNPIKNNNGQMYFGINPKFLKPYIMAPHIKNRK